MIFFQVFYTLLDGALFFEMNNQIISGGSKNSKVIPCRLGDCFGRTSLDKLMIELFVLKRGGDSQPINDGRTQG